MDQKGRKTTFSSSVVNHQQTSRTFQSTASSSTRSTSSSYVSPYRSASESSFATSSQSSSSQYQSVYNNTQRITGTGNFVRHTPAYTSLPQSGSPSLSTAAARATGEKLLSFSSNNNNVAKRSGNCLLPAARTEPPFSLSNQGGGDRTQLGTTSSTVARDARPFNTSFSSASAREANPVVGSYGGFSASSIMSPDSERYNLKVFKGYVLIFHHKHFKTNKSSTRDGSEKDLKLLREFFGKYRVKKPDICEDYTVERVKSKMIEISKKKFNANSCLLVIVMSHGETRDRIQAYDGLYNFEQEVVERVLLNPTLKDKPKLFFIQACRGNARMEVDYTPVATNKNDIMKCYSTYEGTVSFRDKISGTYFIQTLFSLIEEQETKDLAELMVLLRRKFADDRVQQTPTNTTTLTKKFFFKDLR